MDNVITVNYAATGASTDTDNQGMREMQQRAYEKRDEQYILLKAPPASGKSRALMFIALYKLKYQHIRKAIVAVPENTIGASFAPTKLTESDFFADWEPEEKYNLCIPGTEDGKVRRFQEFMESNAQILICTHATLRFAFKQIPPNAFDDCLLAIDEFHHVSADKEANKLGELVHEVIMHSSAHFVAMTGSYFRGDNVPVLLPADEALFKSVVYSYYDQLNGYKHLKSLGIGHHFYQGKYINGLEEILDTDKKTIIHIPNVNSAESMGDKDKEVGAILALIGDEVTPQDGILLVKRRKDGKILKIADLVNDNTTYRARVEAYLAKVKKPEDLDMVIALNKAQEGYDWPMCEHALTIGYRGSLTQIVQIIGRATRDYPGKVHTQFTNLLAMPKASDDEVTLSVNNMLKAITASLLMEQVLAPDFKFLNRPAKVPGEIQVHGLKEPSTQRVKDIVENDLTDLTARVLQDDDVRKAIASPKVDPLETNRVLIPRVIAKVHPELSNAEIEEVRQYIVVNNALKRAKFPQGLPGANPASGQAASSAQGGDKAGASNYTGGQDSTATGAGAMEEDEPTPTSKFVDINGRWILVDDLNINLIDSINPFQGAFEVLSKRLSAPVFRLIRDAIATTRITLTPEEAAKFWNSIVAFKKEHNRDPQPNPTDANEQILYEALLTLQKYRREQAHARKA